MLDDILAAKTKMDRIGDTYLRRVAIGLVGCRVILEPTQREDIVYHVNQRTWDALKDLSQSASETR